jgi:hypothetical protein
MNCIRRFPEINIPGSLPELACTELVEVSKATANIAFDKLSAGKFRQRYNLFWKSPKWN